MVIAFTVCMGLLIWVVPADAALPQPEQATAPTLIERYGYGEGLAEWEVEKLKSIAFCESRYNPYAASSISSAKGVFQFLDSSWRAWGEGSVYDANENVRAAIKYYQVSGFSPWAQCL